MSGYEDVCVVVPMYNEAAVIGDVVTSLLTTFPRVVCVDDGSGDSCAVIARAAGATVVRHSQNLGQGAALQTGIEHAVGQPGVSWVVTFDADGQHRVSDAVAMVERAREERIQVVLGSRFLTGTTDVPRLRRTLLKGAVAFTRVTSRLPLTDTHNGLRVLSRSAATRIRITLDGMAHASQLIEQVAELDLTWTEHPVTIDYTDYSRSRGQSSVNAVNILFEVLGRRLWSRA